MIADLDLMQTLAFAGLALLGGTGPAPPRAAARAIQPADAGARRAAGRVAILIAHGQGVTLFRFDTTLQNPMMIAFFTTIGFGASVSLMRVGGPQVLWFFLLASAFAVAQNVVGVLIALAFGLDPLFGVLAGSVTLTGGPATGLAFAPLFEQAGVTGAGSVAVSVAIGGIVAGGLIGGPVGTLLVERHKLRTPRRSAAGASEPVGARGRSRAGATGRPPTMTRTPGRSSRTSSSSSSRCGRAPG